MNTLETRIAAIQAADPEYLHKMAGDLIQALEAFSEDPGPGSVCLVLDSATYLADEINLLLESTDWTM